MAIIASKINHRDFQVAQKYFKPLLFQNLDQTRHFDASVAHFEAIVMSQPTNENFDIFHFWAKKKVDFLHFFIFKNTNKKGYITCINCI